MISDQLGLQPIWFCFVKKSKQFIQSDIAIANNIAALTITLSINGPQRDPRGCCRFSSVKSRASYHRVKISRNLLIGFSKKENKRTCGLFVASDISGHQLYQISKEEFF